MKTVGFLHTAESHVPVFDNLVQRLAPGTRVHHSIREDFLLSAREAGLTAGLTAAFRDELLNLAGEGCTSISCTCSTLGALAEQLELPGIVLHRIDRAAADRCMNFSSVLVLAAIESAAEAADELLEASRRRCGSQTRWLITLVPGAWDCFERGDLEEYHTRVSDFANQLGGSHDAVFLAQASMLDAASRCVHAPVLTSPEAGVQRLLEIGQSG